MKQHQERLFIGLAIIIVTAAVAIGLYIAGSPAEARVLRQDEVRLDRLQAAHRTIVQYLHERGALPASLDSLTGKWDDAEYRPVDPVGNTPFRYRQLSDSSYEICADFARSSSGGDRGRDEAWSHPAGPHCFTRYVIHPRPTEQ